MRHMSKAALRCASRLELWSKSLVKTTRRRRLIASLEAESRVVVQDYVLDREAGGRHRRGLALVDALCFRRGPAALRDAGAPDACRPHDLLGSKPLYSVILGGVIVADQQSASRRQPEN